MTTKLTGAIAAGALAVGILVGAAGTVLVHDAIRPTMGMDDMIQGHQVMGMMGDGSGMPMRDDHFADHERHHRSSDR